jgi:asparagine synthase (glutamine-hydrolysing)
MTGVMVHRGPDDEGFHRGAGIALGMRRLSVIDLVGSRQPSTNEDGSIHLVFNGEIFNFQELRRDLVARGHRLRSGGDTETIIHLYEDHGAALVRRLRGMFAFALWDSRERKLLLARDRLGVKPLYYTVGPQGLAFASEIKCLLAGGLVTPQLDLDAAALFLSLGYVPAPLTLFAGVRKLPPATTLEWRTGRASAPERYWTPLDPPPFWSGSWEEDEEHLLELLRTAVRMRMISDVPLGVMLSGGLDSSLVAGLMAEASPAPIETFSIGFEEEADANELEWARRTARRLGANHHELLTSANEHDGLLDDALWHLEEPIADLSFIGFLLLSRLARERVTVALCGQAADELLGGYRKHLVSRVTGRSALPIAPLGGMARTLTRHRADSRLGRLGRTVSAADDVERMFAMSAIVVPERRTSVMSERLASADPLGLLRTSFALQDPAPSMLSDLRRTLVMDLQLALPDLMFLYFDKMSMAASLEVRVPFADHELVNFCMALPDNRSVQRWRGKEILRRVSRDFVDESIITRPKRGFFRSGASAWLAARETLLRDTLLDERCRARDLLNVDALRDLLDRPGRGRAGEPLLAAFLLERWHRMFIDGDGHAQSALGPAARAHR